jgi:hypothetical protein
VRVDDIADPNSSLGYRSGLKAVAPMLPGFFSSTILLFCGIYSR